MAIVLKLLLLSSAVTAFYLAPRLRLIRQASRNPFGCSFQSLRNSISEEVTASQVSEQPQYVKENLIQFGKSLPVHIYVDGEIISYLKMKNSDRKSRFLLPQAVASMTLNVLRDYITRRIPTLSGQPYVIRYQVPGEKTTPKQFQGKYSLYFARENMPD
jgi:hypothetical protein